MNFMFSWQEQYLTSERSERVRYCSCHSNIKFISSRHRVISSIYYTGELFRIRHFVNITLSLHRNKGLGQLDHGLLRIRYPVDRDVFVEQLRPCVHDCFCGLIWGFVFQSVVNYFILFALLLACTANLVPRAVNLGKVYEYFTDENKGRVIAVYIALVGIVCFCYLITR